MALLDQILGPVLLAQPAIQSYESQSLHFHFVFYTRALGRTIQLRLSVRDPAISWPCA